MAKRIATIMGVVFILAGIAGFVSNDLLGFHLTFFHNAAVHIVSGAVSLYFGLRGTPAGARMFNLVFGVVYGLIGVVGFLLGSNQSPSAGVPGPADSRLWKLYLACSNWKPVTIFCTSCSAWSLSSGASE